jgi:hypothetical protein
MDNEVSQYFKSLGYSVGWDFKAFTREVWHEIYTKEGKLVCQIDKGVPLSAIIEDLKCFYLGKDGTSNFDYKICAPESEELNELFKKVAGNLY